MKNPYRWAVSAVAVVSLISLLSLAVAQGQSPAPAGPSAGPKVALLDVSRVFKEHKRFKSRMEDMKREVEQAETWAKGERDKITKESEILAQLKRGSPDYQAQEEKLTKNQADLALQIQRQKNRFLQSEAKVYYDVYQEIWSATNYVCQQHRFDMVLRFNGDQVDVERPDSVLAFINKPVVWYNRQLDITDTILAQLNQAPTVNPGPASQNAAPGRQGVQFSR